jgi:hypothetical protein
MIMLRELAGMEAAIKSVVAKRDILLRPYLLGATYSADSDDADVLLRILEHENFLNSSSSHQGFQISISGILEVEKMAATGGEFSQGFVAMWFDPDFAAAWTNGFDPAIRKAGYKPFRIDKKDYVGAITDEIITEIRRSRFVVADYTQQVNGVYFEAGFALGLGLHVIPTCREDHINKLHFDIRHLNTLAWKEPADLVLNLSRRIVAVIGTGPFVEQGK